MKQKQVFLVEGESEKVLLQHLRERYPKITAKYMIFNALQNDLNKFIRTFKDIKQTSFFIVFDCDVLNHKDCNKVSQLIDNFNLLRKHKAYAVWLIQQTNNLEDELISALCLKNSKQLFEYFQSVSKEEFVRRLINSNNLTSKLINFNLARFWEKDLHNTIKKLNKVIGKKLCR